MLSGNVEGWDRCGWDGRRGWGRALFKKILRMFDYVKLCDIMREKVIFCWVF